MGDTSAYALVLRDLGATKVFLVVVMLLLASSNVEGIAVLRRGLTSGDELWTWYQSVISGLSDSAPVTETVTLTCERITRVAP